MYMIHRFRSWHKSWWTGRKGSIDFSGAGTAEHIGR